MEFHPPNVVLLQEIFRFLRNTRKPVILAMSRPDAKKNLTTLIKAFGENNTLRSIANLVLIMVSACYSLLHQYCQHVQFCTVMHGQLLELCVSCADQSWSARLAGLTRVMESSKISWACFCFESWCMITIWIGHAPDATDAASRGGQALTAFIC